MNEGCLKAKKQKKNHTVVCMHALGWLGCCCCCQCFVITIKETKYSSMKTMCECECEWMVEIFFFFLMEKNDCFRYIWKHWMWWKNKYVKFFAIFFLLLFKDYWWLIYKIYVDGEQKKNWRNFHPLSKSLTIDDDDGDDDVGGPKKWNEILGDLFKTHTRTHTA